MKMNGDEGLEIDALMTGDLTIRRWLDHRLETLIVIVIVIVFVGLFWTCSTFLCRSASVVVILTLNPLVAGRMDSVPFSN